MKTTIGVIILAVICLGLAVAVISTRNQAAEQQKKDVFTILDFSNRLDATSSKYSEQVQVNILLTNDLDARRKEMATLTNRLTQVSTTLAKTEGSLKAAQEEVARRDARIVDLETQNKELDQRAVDLTTAITNLTVQIDDTKKKLAASEGDKAFLEKELQRLITEKADLERQFNDLTVLRAQVAKLREELNISRRLEWIRKGLFEANNQKGAQQLLQSGPGAPVTPGETNPSHYDLNVEINADGSVHVIPPLTNRPATTNSPPAQ